MGKLYKNNILYTGQTAVYGGYTPVGSIVAIMGNSAPTNYLKCDGTVYNISAYPELAAYFTAEFGQANKFGGDGTTTFAVPDLRGEFLRGAGANSHELWAGGPKEGDGDTVGTHQGATRELNFFYNGDNNNTLFGIQRAPSTYADPGNADRDFLTSNATAKGRQINLSSSWDSASTVNSHTSRPTNTSVLYCIAYKNIYIENGGGSGSSGHTIQDTDGNDMPAENNLQFIGLLVQDDSTNGATTVEAEGLNADSLDDVTSGSIGNEIINNGMSYSTNEQIVGKWIDGKPIYQKTFNLTTIPADATTIFTGVERLIYSEYATTRSDGAQVASYSVAGDHTWQSGFFVAIPNGTNDVKVFNRGSIAASSTIITIRYTKV